MRERLGVQVTRSLTSQLLRSQLTVPRAWKEREKEGFAFSTCKNRPLHSIENVKGSYCRSGNYSFKVQMGNLLSKESAIYAWIYLVANELFLLSYTHVGKKL